MIAFIEGDILFLETHAAIVKVGGIGYEVMLNKRDHDLLHIGQYKLFYIYNHIREDSHELYGFLYVGDKRLFKLLLSVSGVGPKLALAIISTLHPHELAQAIINKDLSILSSITGIGKKTAERLCLELKDKVMKLDLDLDLPKESTPTSLMQALKSLGYSKDQSDKALASLAPKDLSTLPLESLVKKTLLYLSGKVS